MSERRWRVSSRQAHMSLLAFLRENNPDAVSVKALKRAIDGKCCSVNGKIETFSSHPLKENDLVVLKGLQKREKDRLTVLYEDEDLLIVDKPPGLTCENRYFAPLLAKPARLIHRLDKETSGAVMLAKNGAFLELMIELFRAKKVKKRYLALVDGRLEREQGKIDKPTRAKTDSPRHFGIHALTYWKRLKVFKSASLLLCEPITGRTHQLRVHLSGIGHPILGDTHYGAHFRCPLRPMRQLLHAYGLTFMHPKTQQRVNVLAPVPADFKEALKHLKE